MKNLSFMMNCTSGNVGAHISGPTAGLLDSALALAKRGKPVFPCKPDKSPFTKHGFKDATIDVGIIPQWWTQHPNALIGMPTGSVSGLVVLDVDNKNGHDGDESLHQLQQKYGQLPDTPQVLTPSGGRHIYFRHPGVPIKSTASRVGDGLDIRGDGGYVIVPPSPVNGKGYEHDAASPTTVADMPGWLVNLTKKEAQPAETQFESAGVVCEGNRNVELTSQAGAMRRRGLSVEEMVAVLSVKNAERCNPPLPDTEVEAIARSVGRYEPANCSTPQSSSADATQPDVTPGLSTQSPTDWQSQLIYKNDKTLHSKSQTNACVLLKCQPEIYGVFVKNDFTQSVDVVKKPPWGGNDDDYPRKLQDSDITLAASWLERYQIFVTSSVAHSAIIVAAQYNHYDPLHDFIERLKWDGKPRLTGWVPRLLGAESTEYNEIVGRKFLIGAVARALDPGCKMDTMLVLEGAQGIYKSSAISVLFGADWFTDEIHSIGSKDAAMQLQGNWGIEIPEMHAMSKAEANQIKEWITRRIDKYRPPYGRCVIESPRRCVLIGTLNPEGGYLKDSTGGRRFWPVACYRIDISAIQDEREQLFAEAAYAYRNGEQWWLTKKEDELASEQQEERYETDPWCDSIDAYIDQKERVTTAEVMEHALGLAERDWSRSAEIRISKHLVTCGWRRRRRMINGKRHWHYER